jgi:hypothetical protein
MNDTATADSMRAPASATAAPAGRRPHARLLASGAVALFLCALALAGSRQAGAAAGQSTITVKAFEYNEATGALGSALQNFTFIVSLDNSPNPDNVDPTKRPGVAPMPSHAPLMATGDQDHATVTLPDNNPGERYLISIRSPDHKLWGQYVTFPQQNGAEVDIGLRPTPVKLGKLVIHVFQDDAWTNGAPDTGEGGLAGFHVTLEDQIDGQVSVDYYNQPLCGGSCVTDANGDVTIPNLGPATYFIYVTPPGCPSAPAPTTACANSEWTQTTTIDGGFALLGNVTEKDDGLGMPGETIWEGPGAATGWWFGFVHKSMNFATPGTGSISGTARNWVEWPPFTVTTMGDPVANPFVALTDAGTDTTLYVGQGDAAGNFTIPNVPAGTYNLAIWDEQLTYIMRFVTVTVTAGQPVDLSDLGVSRWFGWLSGYVYLDTGKAYDGTDLGAAASGNGIRDCLDPNDWTTCEGGIPNFPMDQRWRDGSIKDDAVTKGVGDPNGPGYYEYPLAEGGPLGKLIIGEVGFDRFNTEPGASVHNELDPSQVTHVCANPPYASPTNCTTSEGGGLLTNQLISEGHHAVVDWGKRPYAETETGQIVGITYFATTRNEFYGDTATNEPYEAAIPDVEVRLEGAGPDGVPNTADDVVLNDYMTDHWQHPSQSTDGQTCDVTDSAGADLSALLNPTIGPNCLEVPMTGVETKDGAFDGGFAFADYCPPSAGGLDLATFHATGNSACANGSDPVALTPGTYITHMIMPRSQDPNDNRPCNPSGSSTSSAPQPKSISGPFGNEANAQTACLFRPEREEDVNVDLGTQYTPSIPPPPCTGDTHLIDQSTLTSRSPYYGVAGSYAPLCDKKLVVLKPKQNANADFFMMTNFKNGPDVEEPGRVVGSVFDDIYFERDPHSIWYGEPRPLGNVPIGIYDYGYGDSTDAHPRLIATLHTDENGAYQAVLPSTETFNCPIPQGPCPGMYIAVVNDPGTAAHPNANFNPNYLTASTSFDIWPGQTDQLDTPIDPVSGTGCDLASGTPELLQVNRVAGPTAGTQPAGYQSADGPFVRAAAAGTGVPAGYLDGSAASRRIVVQGVNFGTTAGSITLTDTQNRALSSRTFTGLATAANLSNLNVGGIVSWADRQIILQVPAPHAATLIPVLAPFFPGQYQVGIQDTAAAGGLSTTNGIMLHVLGTVGANAYNPRIRSVAKPTIGGHELQNAIDSALANDLVILNAGVYDENVLMSKPLRLQGLGVGGSVGFVEAGGPASEDPRVNIQGSVISGKFFRDMETYWDAKLASLTYVGQHDYVSKGADITVLAPTTTAYGSGINAARIDGIAVELGHGSFGAGGLEVHAYAQNLQVTNNVFESDQGFIGGAINLGTPYHGSQHNESIAIKYDRVMGSGGFIRGGGLTIFNGADNYEVANSTFCSNFSQEYGAGISHWGKSPGGSIHDNKIYYNDAFDSGAGLSIQEETPQPLNSIPWSDPRRGTGSVDISRNVIEANFSGDDGGGIFVANSLTARIGLVNNMFVNNGSADLGGAVMLDDASNVTLVNNTFAGNAVTASSETTDGLTHAAGLTSEGNDPNFQATLPAGSADFSNPVAMFNNIFWQNEGCTLDKNQTPPTLIGCNGEINDPNATYIDLEIHGTSSPTDTFTNARYNLFTNGTVLESDRSTRQLPGATTAPILGFPTDPATNGNTIGIDPLFAAPFGTQFAVAPSRLDPQVASVTIVTVDPPEGIAGDYRLVGPLVSNQISGAVDRGVHCSNTSVPPPANPLAACSAGAIEAPTALSNGDLGGQARPQLRTLRARTPWDRGADEVPTLFPTVPNQ